MTTADTNPELAPLLVAPQAGDFEVYRGRLYIDGQWLEAGDGERVERRSPAHGKVVSTYPVATREDVHAAIDAAHRAFRQGPWPRMKGAERARVLLAVADGIQALRIESENSENRGRDLSCFHECGHGALVDLRIGNQQQDVRVIRRKTTVLRLFLGASRVDDPGIGQHDDIRRARITAFRRNPGFVERRFERRSI